MARRIPRLGNAPDAADGEKRGDGETQDRAREDAQDVEWLWLGDDGIPISPQPINPDQTTDFSWAMP